MQSSELRRLLLVLGEFFPELQNEEVSKKILTIEGQEGGADLRRISSVQVLQHILSSLNDGSHRDEDIDRLRRLCRSLLEITEILLKERTQLYNAHMKILSGGKLSTEQLMQQVDIEASLMDVYNNMLSWEESSSSLKESPEPIMIHSRRFALFTLIFWVLGLFTAILVFEYIRGHEWESSSWNRILIY